MEEVQSALCFGTHLFEFFLHVITVVEVLFVIGEVATQQVVNVHAHAAKNVVEVELRGDDLGSWLLIEDLHLCELFLFGFLGLGCVRVRSRGVLERLLDLIELLNWNSGG